MHEVFETVNYWITSLFPGAGQGLFVKSSLAVKNATGFWVPTYVWWIPLTIGVLLSAWFSVRLGLWIRHSPDTKTDRSN